MSLALIHWSAMLPSLLAHDRDSPPNLPVYGADVHTYAVACDHLSRHHMNAFSFYACDRLLRHAQIPCALMIDGVGGGAYARIALSQDPCPQLLCCDSGFCLQLDPSQSLRASSFMQ